MQGTSNQTRERKKVTRICEKFRRRRRKAQELEKQSWMRDFGKSRPASLRGGSISDVIAVRNSSDKSTIGAEYRKLCHLK